MSFQEFLNKYNGQYVEEAGSTALYQCVDLSNRYIREVLGNPIIEWTNARDFPSKGGDLYEWIPNSPTNVPQEGDLVIWQHNQYGHIAIFIEGDANSFRSFDQNYSTGTPAHVQNHNYTNPPVAGWMRPKKKEVMVQVPSDTYEMLVKNSTEHTDNCPARDKLLHDNEQTNIQKDGIIADLNQKLATVSAEVGELKNEIVDRQNAINTLNLKISDLTQAMEADAVEDHDMGVKLLELEKQLADKDREIEQIKKEKTLPAEQAKEEVINHYEPILEELFKNIIRGKRVKSWKERIWGWFR